MLKKATLTLITAAMIGLTGCGNDQYDELYLTSPADSIEATAPAGATEAELVEQLVSSRVEYIRSLKQLENYYTLRGNNTKGKWAAKELLSVRQSAQYKYLMEAEVAGANLAAADSIQEADDIYKRATELKASAGLGLLPGDADKFRKAVKMFNQVIAKYPTSDKIDDAAFKAGEIYEFFKDYEIAVNYYQRAFQWDENTPYPARFKAAFLYDTILLMRDKAIPLYQGAIEKEPNFRGNVEFATERVKELTMTQESLKIEKEMK